MVGVYTSMSLLNTTMAKHKYNYSDANTTLVGEITKRSAINAIKDIISSTMVPNDILVIQALLPTYYAYRLLL